MKLKFIVLSALSFYGMTASANNLECFQSNNQLLTSPVVNEGAILDLAPAGRYTLQALFTSGQLYIIAKAGAEDVITTGSLQGQNSVALQINDSAYFCQITY